MWKCTPRATTSPGVGSSQLGGCLIEQTAVYLIFPGLRDWNALLQYVALCAAAEAMQKTYACSMHNPGYSAYPFVRIGDAALYIIHGYRAKVLQKPNSVSLHQ